MSQRNDHERDLGRIEDVLDDTAVWSEPPGEIEPALLAAIVGSDRNQRVVAPKPERRRWWPYAAAAVVAAIALVIVFAPMGGEPEPNAIIALAGTGGEGEAAVGAADAGWWIRLNVPDLGPAPQDAFYEGWVSNGEDWVSVGTFHMRDGHDAVLWSGVPMGDFPELVITVQYVGEGTQPSSEVVLTGNLES